MISMYSAKKSDFSEDQITFIPVFGIEKVWKYYKKLQMKWSWLHWKYAFLDPLEVLEPGRFGGK